MPTGVVLDTNVVSEPRRPRPDPNVQSWFARQTVDQLYLTSTIVGEIAFGIALMPSGRRRRSFEAWLRETLLGTFHGRILAYDEEDAVLYGRLMADARAGGRPARVGDAQIAATAMRHGFAIATRNLDDFRLFGVCLIDPWQPAT